MTREMKEEIINELIGTLEPIGETNYDRNVAVNVNLAGAILNKILDNLVCNAEYNGCEGSCLDIKEQSISLLNDCMRTAGNGLYEVMEKEERSERERWMNLIGHKKDLRRILFRGQTRKKGEKVWMNGEPVEGNWEYGGVLQGDGDFSIIYALDFSEIPMDEENIGRVKFKEKSVVHTDTLGQYIGLTDKNKRMIFEHDIVKCYDEMFRKTFIGEVVYRSGSFCIKEAEDDYLYHFRWDDYECEVIGNIYDNPELYVYF